MSFLRQAARNVSRVRAFSSTTVVRKDLVQDIYLREIKAYKPTPAAKDAHVGVVKSYSLPPTPKVPILPADLASELAKYDAAEPTKAPVAQVESTSVEEASGADAYLAFLEADLPKAEAHH
ncbi:hypothetical protein J132_05744 [Termitomyces sp. J132]|nr:hypothetical protein H2248_002715 [Termitomyces sp. 'cryptogamus']KNZ77316.1 hypothetical protein J132_05744 [Termitomyces sp. J132]